MKTSILFLLAFTSLIAASPVDLSERDFDFELEERDVEPWYSYDARDIEPWYSYEARDISWDDLSSRSLSPLPLSPRGVSSERMSKGIKDGNAGAALGQGMFKIIDKLQNDDDKRRIDFVHSALAKYGRMHRGYNVIVVHTDVGYDKDFGKDWGKAHEEVPIHIGGRSKGYDIFWFKKGTFNRHGDGGWINWGYTGAPKRDGGKLTYT